MPCFHREGHPAVHPQAVLDPVGVHLPQEAILDMPILTGGALHDAALQKKSSAGELDGWAWNETIALSLSWFVKLAFLLRQIGTAGRWPQGLFDAHIAMIPKAEGDSTSSGQRSLCVLPVVHRFWASVRLAPVLKWPFSWVPDSVFCASKGVSSCGCWYSTSVDIEEVLSNTRQGDFSYLCGGCCQIF